MDPEPSGPPWRRWEEVGDEAAAVRGVFAPVYTLSFGSPGAIAIAPGDVRGTVLIPERCAGYCCGLDGSDGPNLACVQCGLAVATRIDDCSLWQVVWFDPGAVNGLPADAPIGATADWNTQGRPATPPIDPSGGWSVQWAAAAGAALAHLLAVSDGRPVALPDGLMADLFGRPLDALLPSGAPARTVVPAGPGLPVRNPGHRIFLVPRNPRTGEPWQAPGIQRTVPLPFDMWRYLIAPDERLLLPVTGGLPESVMRDDPLPMRPWRLFRPDRRLFLSTLARIPAVRQPWLREIYDRVNDRPFADYF
ncbi:hypothetical protein [Streptomyces rimosus]|uniref:hypothetical protein n=1 Tax=Streptomyces rimosus TaxID=1927 RepID=UPI002D218F3D|nr:hypothetical protein [Streptomyces rimosus]